MQVLSLEDDDLPKGAPSPRVVSVSMLAEGENMPTSGEGASNSSQHPKHLSSRSNTQKKRLSVFSKDETAQQQRTITLLEKLGHVSNSAVFRSNHSDPCDQGLLSAVLEQLEELAAWASTDVRETDLQFVKRVSQTRASFEPTAHSPPRARRSPCNRPHAGRQASGRGCVCASRSLPGDAGGRSHSAETRGQNLETGAAGPVRPLVGRPADDPYTAELARQLPGSGCSEQSHIVSSRGHESLVGVSAVGNSVSSGTG